MPPRRRYQEYDPSSAPPPVVEEEDESGPIGIPDDYPIPGGVTQPVGPGYGSPTPYTEHGQTPRTTRYMEGDEWLPANYSGDMIFTMQQELVKAGLLTANFTAGVWDPQTREAYRELLGLANAGGLNANQALAQMVANAQAMPQVAEPLITQTTDPTVLRQAFRKTVIELTGQGWSQDQINNMVASYNQMEKQRQQEAFEMEQSGESGNVVDIPDAASWIEAQVREQNPEAVAEEEALGFIGDFFNMATGSSWRGNG